MKEVYLTEHETFEEIITKLRAALEALGPDGEISFKADTEQIQYITAAYIAGRSDASASAPNTPTNVFPRQWKCYIADEAYGFTEEGSQIGTHLCDGDYLTFQVFPGDSGGLFARCIEKPDFVAESETAHELQINIINIIRNNKKEEVN